VPGEVHSVDKPDLDKRANEIPDAVYSYDVGSLCEVWRPEERTTIIDILRNHDPALTTPIAGAADPPFGAWQHLGNGLLVFSQSYGLTDGGWQVYSPAGVSRMTKGGCDFGLMVDSDVWARKGVQRSLLDVGFGLIEIYSTHLYSGGAMPDWLGSLFGGAPSDEEMVNVRLAQINQLAQFIAETHDPANVAIIAGDFNVGAVERTNLVQTLYSINGWLFDEWYGLPMFAKIYPQAPTTTDPGHTNRGEDTPTFDTICKVFPKAVPATNLPNDYYCDDTSPPDPDPTGERIDYVFVQRPEPSHTFYLEVSRLRRRAFKRPGTHGQPQYFMSDHLGLELTMFASPGPVT
jgi:hypothetical protein